MINLPVDQQNKWLAEQITGAGYTMMRVDNEWVSDNDVAVQAIIDTFNPLPFAVAESINRVKQSAAQKYAQYASSAPGKDAVYAAKEAEAVQYGIDATVGPYMQARINKTGETATVIAAEWSDKSAIWNALAAQIDAIQDNATQQINAAATVAECETIANAAIAEIEAL